MSCLDYRSFYAEPSPPPHRHILCNGLSEPLPGATCLSSSLHPSTWALSSTLTPELILELRSWVAQTPGWHLIGSSRRSGGWRVRGWVEMECEPREASMWRGEPWAAGPPATARNVPRRVLTSQPSPLQLRIHSPHHSHFKGQQPPGATGHHHSITMSSGQGQVTASL